MEETAQTSFSAILIWKHCENERENGADGRHVSGYCRPVNFLTKFSLSTIRVASKRRENRVNKIESQRAKMCKAVVGLAH